MRAATISGVSIRVSAEIERCRGMIFLPARVCEDRAVELGLRGLDRDLLRNGSPRAPGRNE